MIQIEWDPEDGLCIVEGFDEFFKKMDKYGTVKVMGASDGKIYYVHEVGEEVHIMNQEAQSALVRLADALIQDASTGRWI